MSKSKGDVIDGVAKWASWWFQKRQDKLENQLTETMSINPFLMPFLFDYHDLKGFGDLANLLAVGHLLTGHNTGFGKLIDEKILPEVFGAKKLSKTYREQNSPFNESCFDEVDHLIRRDDDSIELLSLKAGKWTIQLTMAVQLNSSFAEILRTYPHKFNSIIVGVFYGKRSQLTDKYDILRGINRGANHDVEDLTNSVFVYAGKEFWQWLNDDEEKTQQWVLEGIQKALKSDEIHKTASALLSNFKKAIETQYQDCVDSDGAINWPNLLIKING